MKLEKENRELYLRLGRVTNDRDEFKYKVKQRDEQFGLSEEIATNERKKQKKFGDFLNGVGLELG